VSRILLLRVFLFLTLALPIAADSFVLPSFYARMDNSVSVSFFDDNLVPEAYQAGNQLETAGRMIAGFLVIPFPFTLEFSFSLQVPEKKVGFLDLFLSYFSDSYMLSIGKQKIDWGVGNVYRPLYYLNFVTDPYAKYLIGREAPRVWQADFFHYSTHNTLSLKGISEKSFIEKLEKPLWWSVMVQDELSFSDFSIIGQTAYLYKNKDDIFNDKKNSFICGIESKYILNNSLSFSFAQSAMFPSDISDYKLEGTILFDMISSDNVFFFSPEIGYKEDNGLLGVSLGYTPQSGHFSTGLNFKYDYKYPGFMLFISTDLNISDVLTFQIAGHWTKGKAESVFADFEVPFSLIFALKANLY